MSVVCASIVPMHIEQLKEALVIKTAITDAEVASRKQFKVAEPI